MRHLPIFIILLAAAHTSPIIAECKQIEKQGLGMSTVKGRVYKTNNKHPIANAFVVLLGVQHLDTHKKKIGVEETTTESRTDDKGNFIFKTVQPGLYEFSILIKYDKEIDLPCKRMKDRILDKKTSISYVLDGKKIVEGIYTNVSST